VTTKCFDHIFQTKLHSWTPIRSGYQAFFSPREIGLLGQSEQTFDNRERTVVFVIFENDYAALGGLATIAKSLPKFMKEAGENVVFISPFHQNNKNIQQAYRDGRFVTLFEDMRFTCGNFASPVTCLQDISADVPSYFCALDNSFTAQENPYDYPDPDMLGLDSLIFCAALPSVLGKLGLKKNLLIHAHDWETSAVALTSKMAVLAGQVVSAKTVLTLHNSYDARLPASLMSRFFGMTVSTETFLQTFIPLLNGPLTTVSTPFAHELRFDPLQTGVFTRHLQRSFSQNPPIGVENGVFGDKTAPFSASALKQCEKQDFSLLLQEKERMRQGLITCMQSYRNDHILGTIEFPEKSEKVPVFFMTGRLDLMQKGFDAMLLAFQRLERKKAKLFFGLNIGSKSEDFSNNVALLAILNEAVLQCRGDLTVWPFRIPEKDYALLLKGASYLIMPSFYEPFGSATEGFISGTPVVARATGGLWLQVEACNEVYIPPFYGSLFKPGEAPRRGTGILFREQYPDSMSETEWNNILNLPLRERITSSLYKAIVESAYCALETAVDIFADPSRYGQLIAHGITSLSSFPWARSVEKYRKIYDRASRNVV
jgi:glycogen synthase